MGGAAGAKGIGLGGKLLIAGVVLVVGVAAAAVIVPRLIDWEKVRAMVEEKGTAALGRQLTVKSLSVGLFSGVEIGGVKLGARKGWTAEPMVECDRIVARYRLLPLLWLSVQIHKVELVKPRIFVERSRKGEWSFSDLAGSAKEVPAADSPKAKPVVLPISLDVRTVRVTDGSLKYRDSSGKKPVTASVDNLDVLVRDFSLTGKPATVKVGLVVEGYGLKVPVSIDGGLGVNLNGSVVTLRDLAVVLPGVRAVTNGEVTEFQVLPTLNVKESVTVDVGKAWDAIKGALDAETRKAVNPVGAVSVNVGLSGTMKRLKLEGEAVLKGVGLSYGELGKVLESMDGKVSFTEDRLSMSDLRFIAIDSPFTLGVDISGLGLSDPASFDIRKFAPKGTVKLESSKVVLDRFIPSSSKGGGKGKKGAAEEPPAPEPDLRGLVPRGADISGEVKLDEVRARQLVLTKQVLRFRVADGVATFDQVSTAYGGNETAAGKVGLEKFPLEVSASLKMDAFQAEPFMTDAIASFVTKSDMGKGRVSGTAGMSVEAVLKGVTYPNIRKNLKAKGVLDVKKGELKKLEFFSSSMAKTLKLGFLDKDIGFESLGGNFTVVDGKFNTPDMTMDPGADGEMGLVYKGMVDFDTKLKGEMTTRFNKRYKDNLMQGKVGKMAFTEENGCVVGIWDVSGTVTLPVLTPSKKMLGKKAKQAGQDLLKKETPKLKETGAKLLKGLLKKR